MLTLRLDRYALDTCLFSSICPPWSYTCCLFIPYEARRDEKALGIFKHILCRYKSTQERIGCVLKCDITLSKALGWKRQQVLQNKYLSIHTNHGKKSDFHLILLHSWIGFTLHVTIGTSSRESVMWYTKMFFIMIKKNYADILAGNETTWLQDLAYVNIGNK